MSSVYKGFRIEKLTEHSFRVYGANGHAPYVTVGSRAVPVVGGDESFEAPSLAVARREIDQIIADTRAGRSRSRPGAPTAYQTRVVRRTATSDDHPVVVCSCGYREHCLYAYEARAAKASHQRKHSGDEHEGTP
jgi:hypothetical protein